MNFAAAPRDALHKPFAVWLVEDSTPCQRCHGPRDSHQGCEHCRERRITEPQPKPEVLR